MKLLKQFAWVSASRFAAAILQALTFIVIARESSPSIFGLFATFMGIALVVHTLFDLGISSYIVRTRAEDRASPEIPFTLRLYRVLGIGQGATLIGLGLVLSGTGGIDWFVFLPIALASAVERQTDVRLGLSLADGDIWKNVLIQLIRRTLTLTLTLTLVRYLPALVSYGISYFLGSTAGLVIAFALIHVGRISTTRTPLSRREIIRVSRPFWVNSLSAQLRNLDVLIVSMTSTAAAAGYYGAIARSISPLSMFSASLAAVIYPQAVRDRMSGTSTLTRPVLVVLAFLMIAYGVLAAGADMIVRLLLGDEYLPAVDGLRIVLLSLIFASLTAILTAILQAYRFEKVVGVISALTSILSLTGIFIGASLYGVTGAALGLAVAYVVQAVLMFACGGPILLGRRRGKHV
ncbi:lipopolysaccharide biosynthesis protein [Kocuria rosea]|uniref:Polysaccharide biosynthesis protein n=1 Tax=Kocuria rosea TaxID=1275 RepID=A0A4R5YGL7_KOCRO|nr:oligosaccharide flippase family protein [Kocuria rosea]TDL42443.1 hypothetical protein E2R59_10880 [Kocuria rosea]